MYYTIFYLVQIKIYINIIFCVFKLSDAGNFG